MAPWASWSAAGEIVDPNVVAFEASPSYINLNRTTSITVEIGSSYGAGLDNYRATVTAPDATQWSMWYNFTGIGSMAEVFGDGTTGFMAIVDQVGQYDLLLEYFDGSVFTPAAYAQLATTDELVVVTEGATASNEFTDTHNCPLAQEFQRGGEIIARAYVRYASTGEFVNGTANPSAAGNITGTLLGEAKDLRWQNVYHFWRWAWYIPWDAPAGIIVFTVDASDGLGNHGVGSSPTFGLTSWRITPAILKVVTRVLNATGDEDSLFRPGDTVTIEATVTYEGHKAHNTAFPGPLNGSRGGQVTATIGWGQFDSTMGVYENFLMNITLTHDAATEKWFGTYDVPTSEPNHTDVQAWIFAIDSNNPPNAGSSFTSRLTIEQLPAPVEIEVPIYNNNTIYDNRTVVESTGFELPVVAGLSIGLLVAGVAVGAVLFRRRKPKSPMEEMPSDAEGPKEGEEL